MSETFQGSYHMCHRNNGQGPSHQPIPIPKLNTSVQPTLFKMAFELGAGSTSDFTDRVTHLIASSHGGAKYLVCSHEQPPLVLTHVPSVPSSARYLSWIRTGLPRHMQYGYVETTSTWNKCGTSLLFDSNSLSIPGRSQTPTAHLLGRRAIPLRHR